MKGINLQINDFENDIVKYINNSNLPIIIKRNVVERILNQLVSGTNTVLNDEIKKYQEELKNIEEKGEEEEDVNEHE